MARNEDYRGIKVIAAALKPIQDAEAHFRPSKLHVFLGLEPYHRGERSEKGRLSSTAATAKECLESVITCPRWVQAWKILPECSVRSAILQDTEVSTGRVSPSFEELRSISYFRYGAFNPGDILLEGTREA